MIDPDGNAIATTRCKCFNGDKVTYRIPPKVEPLFCQADHCQSLTSQFLVEHLESIYIRFGRAGFIFVFSAYPQSKDYPPHLVADAIESFHAAIKRKTLMDLWKHFHRVFPNDEAITAQKPKFSRRKITCKLN